MRTLFSFIHLFSLILSKCKKLFVVHLSLTILLLCIVGSGYAAIYTVTNTSDTATSSTCNGTDPCSLRQAINDANANPGLDTIAFNIPGSGVQTITPTLNVLCIPALTYRSTYCITDDVIIDGYTQPGASPRMAGSLPGVANEIPAVLKIFINGSQSAFNGIVLYKANNSVIRGLVISNFGANAVTRILRDELNILDGTNDIVVGNYFGTDATGMTDSHIPFVTGRGILISSANSPGLTPRNNRVGGYNPADRNIFGYFNRKFQLTSNTVDGTAIASGNQIIGNLFGAAADGVTGLSSGTGNINIITFGANNTLIDGNIVKNAALGIQLQGGPQFNFPSSTGVIVKNNFVSNNVLRGIFLILGHTGAVIDNNTIVNNGGFAGLTLRDVNYSMVENNIIGKNNWGIGFKGNVNNNKFTHNWIGTDRTGANLGNLFDGIDLGLWTFVDSNGIPTAGESGIPGPTGNLITGNTIAFNQRAGVLVGSDHDGNLSNPGSALDNAILVNSIYSNGGLGIDLTQAYQDFTFLQSGNIVRIDVSDGVTLNDSVGHNGANHFQDFPILDVNRSMINPALIIATGVLHALPNTQYLIEFYTDDHAVCSAVSGIDLTFVPSADCPVNLPFLAAQAKYFIGNLIVTTDANGDAPFSSISKNSVPVGEYLAATATRIDSISGLPVETSEISQAVDVDHGGAVGFQNAQGAAGGDKGNASIIPLQSDVNVPEVLDPQIDSQ